jgi:hypothetical protein
MGTDPSYAVGYGSSSATAAGAAGATRREIGTARVADRFAEGDQQALKLLLGLLLELERRAPANLLPHRRTRAAQTIRALGPQQESVRLTFRPSNFVTIGHSKCLQTIPIAALQRLAARWAGSPHRERSVPLLLLPTSIAKDSILHSRCRRLPIRGRGIDH